MSAHLADSQLNHRLPSLSYIDAKWEEPELRQSAHAAPRRTLTAWLAAQWNGIQTWFRDNESYGELTVMSDRELHDMGLTRSDLDRVFDSDFNQDLRHRGRYM